LPGIIVITSLVEAKYSLARSLSEFEASFSDQVKLSRQMDIDFVRVKFGKFVAFLLLAKSDEVSK
jgi:hypothetical protein